MINELISTYAMPILGTILTGIASYVGLKVKSIYEKYVTDKTKKQVVQDVVKFVEQVYTDMHGQEKYNKAIENVIAILNEKDIQITELEVQMLIESTCNEFKNILKGSDK